MENCVAPGLDAFDVLLEVVLSLVRVAYNITGFIQKFFIILTNVNIMSEKTNKTKQKKKKKKNTHTKKTKKKHTQKTTGVA